MKLTLSVLQYHLSKLVCESEECVCPDARKRFDRVRSLDRRADRRADTRRNTRLDEQLGTRHDKSEEFAENTAYLGEWSDISKLDTLPEIIICIGGNREAHEYLSGKKSEALIFPDGTDKTRLFEAICDVLLQYAGYEQEIQAAIIRKVSVNELLTIVSKVFGNPVILYDAPLRVLGSSEQPDENTGDSYWGVTIKNGISNQEVMRMMKEAGLIDSLNTSERALFIVHPPVEPFISANFMRSGTRIATLGIVTHKNELDERLLPIADNIVDLLQIVIYGLGNTYYMRSSNLQKAILDMLGGALLDRNVIQNNLSVNRWDINDEYQIVSVDVDHAEKAGGTAQYVRELARELFPDSVAVDYQDEFFLVLHLTGHQYIDDTINNDFRLLLQNRNCRAGVSMRFYDFSLISGAYKLANIALDKGKTLTVPGVLYRYEDCFVSHLIDLCAISIDVASLCHPEAIRLFKYDNDNNSDFLSSLYMYITEERSIAAAAKKMNIHRNTLIYRLNRIRDIFAIDLDDNAQRFHLIWSYQVLKQLYPGKKTTRGNKL